MEDITGLLKPCAAVALVGTCLPIDSDGPSISNYEELPCGSLGERCCLHWSVVVVASLHVLCEMPEALLGSW